MQINRINQLLEKYFDGSTSVDEELILKKYFSGKEVADEHLQFQSLFIGLSDFSSAEMNRSLHEKILNEISDYKNEEKISRQKSLNRILIGVAAAIWILLLFKPSASQWKDTYSDPRQARIEAEKTLLFVSAKYNKGLKQLEYLSKVNESIEPIQKSFSTINSSVATIENSIDFKNMNQK